MAGEKKISVIVQAIDQLTGPLQNMSKQTAGFVKGVQGVFKGLMAGVAALGLGKFFKDSVNEALEAEKSMARLDAALRNVGLNYKLVSPDVERYLNTLQRTTRFSDDEGREALTRLVVATGNYQQSLKDMQVVADLAAFKQISLSEAANIVAKAHVGVGRELKGMGIEVKAGVDAVPQLTERLKGFEEQSRTMSDKLQMTNNLWNDFKEQIGLALIGSENAAGGLTTLQQALVDLSKWVENNSDTITGFIDKLLSFGEVVAKVSEFIVNHTPNWYSLGKAIGVIGKSSEESAERTQRAQTAGLASSYLNAQRSLEIARRAAGDRNKLTEEELKKEEEARERARKARQKAAEEQAASRKALLEFERDFFSKSIDLEGMQRQAIEALEITHQEIMRRLRGDDLARARELMQQQREAVEAHWRAINAVFEEQAPRTAKVTGTASKATDELKVSTTNLFDVLRSRGVPVWKDANKETEKHGEQQDKTKQKIAGTAKAVHDAADRFLEFAQAIGGVDEQTASLVRGIGDLADGLGKVATGDPGALAGGLLQAVTGLSGVIGGLFGAESASARYLRQELEKHRASLEKHRERLGDLIEISRPGRELASAEQALRAALAPGGAKIASLFAPQAITEAELARFLLPRGFTVAEFEELAKAVPGAGSLRDAKGRFDRRLLQAFLDLLGTFDTAIPQDFASQLAHIRKLSELRGGTRQELLEDVLKLLASEDVGSPFLASAFSHFDAATAEGRAKILEALPALLAGRELVGKTGLGGLSLSQFEDVLDLLAGLLRDVAGEEERAATDEAARKKQEQDEADRAAEDVRRESARAAQEREREAEELQRAIERAREQIAEETEAIRVAQLTPEEQEAEQEAARSPAARIAAAEKTIREMQGLIDAALERLRQLGQASGGLPGLEPGAEEGPGLPIEGVGPGGLVPIGLLESLDLLGSIRDYLKNIDAVETQMLALATSSSERAGGAASSPAVRGGLSIQIGELNIAEAKSLEDLVQQIIDHAEPELRARWSQELEFLRRARGTT